MPGESHGRRSLVGASPWGRKESDTTERLHLHQKINKFGKNRIKNIFITNMAEEKISQLEDIVIEIIENEMQREKNKGREKGKGISEL